MFDALRDPLLRLLRVPSEPEPPPGDPRAVRTFRAARRYFHYRVVVWLVRQVSALIGIIFGYLFFRAVLTRSPLPNEFIGVVELFFIAAYIVQLPFSFMLMRLDFELRWYMLSDRSLRIREGIMSVREHTMTFANIQNIEIRQNPLERLFGIANVAVRAAGGGSGSSQQGGGGASGGPREARFEGVDNAAQIREVIRERVRQHRDSGLGDPDDHVAPRAVRGVDRAHGASAAAGQAGTAVVSGDAMRPVLTAARELLAEARALNAR